MKISNVARLMLNIVLMFIIIQICLIIKNPLNVYADESSGTSGESQQQDGQTSTGGGFIDKVFKGGQEWSDMADKSGTKSNDILNNSGILNTTDEIYNVCRAIGVMMIIIKIVMIFVTLKTSNSGQVSAETKLSAVVVFVIALLLINAKTIFDSVFSLIDSLMKSN